MSRKNVSTSLGFDVKAGRVMAASPLGARQPETGTKRFPIASFATFPATPRPDKPSPQRLRSRISLGTCR
jgi:hypothetical protein